MSIKFILFQNIKCPQDDSECVVMCFTPIEKRVLMKSREKKYRNKSTGIDRLYLG
jgi:hypothetical protein